MAEETAISEDQYVRFTDGKGSLPSIRSKLSSSGRTVTPLNINMDEKTMELLPRPKKPRGFNKQFQQMLSQGKGISVFEAIRQERLKLGATEIPFADEKVLTAKDNDGFTILHHAARCNVAEAVNILLDNGVDVDRVENMGFTPLHVAVRHKSTEAVKALLKRGADPSIPDNEKATPLLFAARRGYIEIAGLLLNDPRTDVNYANLAGITPFHAACASGERSLCELLLAHGAELTAKSSNLLTALHFAAFGGNVDVCELVISTAKKRCPSLKNFLEERDVEDATALHMSCSKGYTGVTELLLRHGVDCEAGKGVNLSTPLHLATTHGHEEVIRLLISSGAVIDYWDGHLKTPLHQAAMGNKMKIVEILLDKGADIEAKNMMDLTPFLIAVIHGSKETAEMLLDRGANLMAIDSAHNSCLHLAVIHKRKEILQMLLDRGKGKLMELRNNELKSVIHLAACNEEMEILNILLDQTFSTKQRDINEKIPLHHAAENGSLECIKSLLRCPLLMRSMGDRDAYGMSPLHQAALNKHAEACKLLIYKGGDITSQDHRQRTPLHLAVKSGSLETVQVLLNPMLPNTLEVQDIEQQTPLHIACMHNRLDVLRFLLDKGADVATRNKDHMTCLDVAIEWDSVEVAKTLVKHERWKEVICASSAKDKIPPMEKLIDKLPEVAEIVLDQCVSFNQLPTTHPDYAVTFLFTPLDPLDDLSCGRYFFGPGSMATHRRESLLNHSVTQMLLRWKWLLLGKFVNYFNFALFFVFLVLFSVFIVDQRDKVRLSRNSEADTTMAMNNEESKAIPSVIFAFLIIKILEELTQMFWLQLGYFKDYTNFLDIAMYSSTMIYILPYVTKDDLYGDAQVQWTAGTVALLLCYVNWILSLRRVSSVALYVTMYVEVFVTFLKVITIFTIVLMGYALVFHVLLKEEVRFEDPLRQFRLDIQKVTVKYNN